MNTQQTRRIAQTALVIVLEVVAASSIGVAQSANAREERSKSALLEAASLQSNAKGERRIENRAEADRLLRQVLVEGTTEQKALAANNLGALLHEDNRNGEAVAVFRAIPFDALKPEQAVVYRYNFAAKDRPNRRSLFGLRPLLFLVLPWSHQMNFHLSHLVEKRDARG